jgi:hypothetical protein
MADCQPSEIKPSRWVLEGRRIHSMNHHLIAVAGMRVGTGVANLRQLLSISVLAIVVTGCSSPVSLDVLEESTAPADEPHGRRHPSTHILASVPISAFSER